MLAAFHTTKTANCAQTAHSYFLYDIMIFDMVFDNKFHLFAKSTTEASGKHQTKAF